MAVALEKAMGRGREGRGGEGGRKGKRGREEEGGKGEGERERGGEGGRRGRVRSSSMSLITDGIYHTYP